VRAAADARAARRAAALLGLALWLAGCASVVEAPPPAAPPAAPPPPVVVAAPGAVPSAPPVTPAPAPEPRPLRIGLALGGGAARGFAHVGVIKALEARGIHPEIVVGTSVGSFVAALYAAGYGGMELQRAALQFEEGTIADWSLPSRGLFKGLALQDYVNRAVQQRPIEGMRHKLAIVATDLGSGEMMVFERGNVGMAVRASSSVPGVFQPIDINGHEYVDGGLVSPVPVRVARKLGADVVIAVDISKRPAAQSTNGTVDILLQTFAIMGQVIARAELQGADLVLRPALDGVASTDFQNRELAIREGEQAVTVQAEALDALLARARADLVRPAALANP
jgi:NTE family protein